MRELHLTRKDFRIDWYSGTGGGGQYRNKHQNCCRITHLGTGLVATGQSNRDRPSNQREAFNALARKILAHYQTSEERHTDGNEVRVYHAERNEVLDKASRLRRLYSDVVTDGDLGEMIEARCKAMNREIS